MAWLTTDRVFPIRGRQMPTAEAVGAAAETEGDAGRATEQRHREIARLP